MNIDEINPLDVAPDQKLVALQKSAKEQLNIADHNVMSTADRPDKRVYVPTGEKDENGEDKTVLKIESVNRIPVPLQKIIVKRRVAFMNVKNIKLLAQIETDEEQRMFDFVNKIREDNKLRYRESQVARKLLEDLQVAKLYYFEEGDTNSYPKKNRGASKLRMRMRILAPSLGDTLIPIFDGFGSMVMFIRKYQDQDENDITEVFTSEYINVYTNDELDTERSGANLLGKIPIVYYSLNETVWNDVQPMIERLENLISNFADTVDYNGAPILVAKGTILGFSERGERGKVFELEGEGAGLDYVNWDSAPEAIKLEKDTLIELIFSCSQTPNITFEQMKGLGGLSGVGMDRVFLDAQLAANDLIDGGYGESTQRDINLQIAGAILIDPSLASLSEFEIWFDLEPYRFDDKELEVSTIVQAYQGGIISLETAVQNSPFSEGSGSDELARIIAESGTRTIEQAEQEEDV